MPQLMVRGLSSLNFVMKYLKRGLLNLFMRPERLMLSCLDLPGTSTVSSFT